MNNTVTPALRNAGHLSLGHLMLGFVSLFAVACGGDEAPPDDGTGLVAANGPLQRVFEELGTPTLGWTSDSGFSVDGRWALLETDEGTALLDNETGQVRAAACSCFPMEDLRGGFAFGVVDNQLMCLERLTGNASSCETVPWSERSSLARGIGQNIGSLAGAGGPFSMTERGFVGPDGYLFWDGALRAFSPPLGTVGGTELQVHDGELALLRWSMTDIRNDPGFDVAGLRLELLDEAALADGTERVVVDLGGPWVVSQSSLQVLWMSPWGIAFVAERPDDTGNVEAVLVLAHSNAGNTAMREYALAESPIATNTTIGVDHPAHRWFMRKDAPTVVWLSTNMATSMVELDLQSGQTTALATRAWFNELGLLPGGGIVTASGGYDERMKGSVRVNEGLSRFVSADGQLDTAALAASGESWTWLTESAGANDCGDSFLGCQSAWSFVVPMADGVSAMVLLRAAAPQPRSDDYEAGQVPTPMRTPAQVWWARATSEPAARRLSQDIHINEDWLLQARSPWFAAQYRGDDSGTESTHRETWSVWSVDAEGDTVPVATRVWHVLHRRGHIDGGLVITSRGIFRVGR